MFCLHTRRGHPGLLASIVTADYEPPCGCWELNLGALEDQLMLFSTEPPLRPPVMS